MNPVGIVGGSVYVRRTPYPTCCDGTLSIVVDYISTRWVYSGQYMYGAFSIVKLYVPLKSVNL